MLGRRGIGVGGRGISWLFVVVAVSSVCSEGNDARRQATKSTILVNLLYFNIGVTLCHILLFTRMQ